MTSKSKGKMAHGIIIEEFEDGTRREYYTSTLVVEKLSETFGQAELAKVSGASLGDIETVTFLIECAETGRHVEELAYSIDDLTAALNALED